MGRLIDALPAPLLDDLVQGRWLPLVGAGFSRNAEYDAGLPPADWRALGAALGAALKDADTDAPPIELISAFEQSFGRVALVDRVGELIRARDAKPGPAHIAFAEVAFRNVITTNFDFLLERAYDQTGRGCLPLVDEGQLSAVHRGIGPRLFKMHGDLHHPSRLILTEDDYDRFLLEYPLLATTISAMFVDHTGVLIGYSLDDADTRQILALLRQRLGALQRPLWTILFNADAATVSRFERRGVKVVNLRLPKGKDLGGAYQQLFDELAAHWRAAVPNLSEASDDRVTADLQAPGVGGRLCYFAVPVRLIGWYRDTLFPLVDRAGLVPVTARDIYSAPGSVGAKIDALVERAAAVVAEVGGEPYAEYEARLALSKLGPRRTLLISGERDTEYFARPERYNVDLWQQLQLRRPNLDADPEYFLKQFARWLESLPVDDGQSSQEPRRLLAAGEYGPAVVSAFSLLEFVLARVLAVPQAQPPRITMRALLRAAREQNLVHSEAELDHLEQAATRRNEIVHRVKSFPPRVARADVNLVLEIVARANEYRAQG